MVGGCGWFCYRLGSILVIKRFDFFNGRWQCSSWKCINEGWFRVVGHHWFRCCWWILKDCTRAAHPSKLEERRQYGDINFAYRHICTRRRLWWFGVIINYWGLLPTRGDRWLLPILLYWLKYSAIGNTKAILHSSWLEHQCLMMIYRLRVFSDYCQLTW